MKVRIGAAALLAFLALIACSSSTNGKGSPFQGGGSTPAITPPVTTSSRGSGSGGVSAFPTTSDTGGGGGGSSTAFCTKLKQAQTSLGQISSSMSDPSKAKDVLNEEAAIFNSMEKDAPAEIAPALHDLSTVMSAAAKYFENPGAGSTGALQDLSTKFPDDLQKIGTYVAANCR
jgi:hypothetical protein